MWEDMLRFQCFSRSTTSFSRHNQFINRVSACNLMVEVTASPFKFGLCLEVKWNNEVRLTFAKTAGYRYTKSSSCALGLTFIRGKLPR